MTFVHHFTLYNDFYRAAVIFRFLMTSRHTLAHPIGWDLRHPWQISVSNFVISEKCLCSCCVLVLMFRLRTRACVHVAGRGSHKLGLETRQGWQIKVLRTSLCSLHIMFAHLFVNIAQWLHFTPISPPFVHFTPFCLHFTPTYPPIHTIFLWYAAHFKKVLQDPFFPTTAWYL